MFVTSSAIRTVIKPPKSYCPSPFRSSRNSKCQLAKGCVPSPPLSIPPPGFEDDCRRRVPAERALPFRLSPENVTVTFSPVLHSHPRTYFTTHRQLVIMLTPRTEYMQKLRQEHRARGIRRVGVTLTADEFYRLAMLAEKQRAIRFQNATNFTQCLLRIVYRTQRKG